MKWYLLLSIVLSIALLFVWFGPELMPDSDSLIPTTQSTAHTEEKHIHHYSVRESLPATCTEDGFNVTSCECGDSLRVTTELAKGHRFEFIETIPPTETKGGYTLYVCHCGAEKRTDETQPLGALTQVENLSFCTDSEGRLLYYYKNESSVSEKKFVCNEPVQCSQHNGAYLYFVKSSEPGVLYSAPLADLSSQNPVCDYQDTTIVGIQTFPHKSFRNEALVLTKGNKSAVILDLLTCKETLIAELPFLDRLDLVQIELDKDEKGEWTYRRHWIDVNGVHNKEYVNFFYDVDTGLFYEPHIGYVMLRGEAFVDHREARMNEEKGGLFFIKRSEPTKLYYTSFADTTNHTLIYESKDGPIRAPYYYENLGYLCLTVNNSKSILLNLSTGETSVFLEMPEINRANIRDIQIVDGKITYHLIYFEGKHPQDADGGAYLYDIDAGTFEEVGQGYW
jgi:hypothetical protein